MNAWFNYEATLKILLFSLLAGAALPGLFAVGIRLQAAGSVDAGLNGSPVSRARCWWLSAGRFTRWWPRW